MSNMKNENEDLANIYDYDSRYQESLQTLKDSNKVTESNKEEIREFLKKCSDISKRTKQKHLICLQRVLERLDEEDDLDQFPLEDAEEDNIDDSEIAIQRTDYSSEYKRAMKIALKKFYKVMTSGSGYPEMVEDVDTNAGDNKKKRIDVLEPEEVQEIISEISNTRDKAMIKVMYEGALRIGELLTLQIRDVKFQPECVKIQVREGRTGERDIHIVESERYLRSWLDNHPMSDDRKAPLWVKKSKKRMTQNQEDKVTDRETLHEQMRLSYNYIYRKLKKHTIEAGIRTYTVNGETKTDVHPHLLRHSRATVLSKHWSDQQLKDFMGWSKSSSMPETYVHLDSGDQKNAVLDLYGIENEDGDERQEKECPRCERTYKGVENFCPRCGCAFNQETAITYKQTEKASQEITDQRLEGMDKQEIINRLQQIENQIQ